MQKETIQNHFLQSCLKDSKAQQQQSNTTLNYAPKNNPQNKSLNKKEINPLEHFYSPNKNFHQNNKYFVQTPPTFQKHNIKNVQALQQTRRNRMKDQNLLQVQIAFRLLDIQNDSHLKNRQNLAKIALELGESQGNILRHYRLFRRNMSSNFSREQQAQQAQQAQYDQLESSQRKIKLEKLITDFIRQKTYFAVGQFVYNAKQTIKTQYTKKQIQQCLCKMSQKKILICDKKEENTDDYVYDLFKTYIQNGNTLLFFSHYTYTTNQKRKFTVGLLCGDKGITYLVFPINGQEKRHTIEILLEMYFRQYGRIQKFLVITAFQDVYNSKSIIDDDIHQKRLHEILQPWGSSLFILQQKKEYMNIAFRILHKYKIAQGKTYPQFMNDTLGKLLSAKKYFLKEAFSHFTTKKPSRTSISAQKYQAQMRMQAE